jgi:hypothetical protein
VDRPDAQAKRSPAWQAWLETRLAAIQLKDAGAQKIAYCAPLIYNALLAEIEEICRAATARGFAAPTNRIGFFQAEVYQGEQPSRRKLYLKLGYTPPAIVVGFRTSGDSPLEFFLYFAVGPDGTVHLTDDVEEVLSVDQAAIRILDAFFFGAPFGKT